MTFSQKLIQSLKKHASPSRKKSNEWFFKTGPGQYGYGDKFIGLTVPATRAVATKFSDLSSSELTKVLASPIHEVRLAGLLILVGQYKFACKNKNFYQQKKLLRFYLKNCRRVNNWDLVDLSAPYIIGQALERGLWTKKDLLKLARSANMWQRRMAIVGTWALIRQGKIDLCLQISKLLLHDNEDLLHKAVGWMLRESWKQKPAKTEIFLRQNYTQLPRTALRYAIERMPAAKRKRYLQGKF